MPDTKPVLKGRLDGRQRNRLKSLLNMMYRPSELAEEVGFGQNQVYIEYLPLGCPHQRDSNNHIWINGEEFKEWYQETYNRDAPNVGEVYCISCKAYRKMKKPVRRVYSESGSYDLYLCPECGRQVARFVSQE